MRVCHAGQHATTVLCNVKPYLTARSHGVGYTKPDRYAAVTFLLRTLRRRITDDNIHNLAHETSRCPDEYKTGRVLYILNTIFVHKNLKQFSS
jgi:hypothetical protein